MTLKNILGFISLAAILCGAFWLSAQERPAPTPKNPPLFKGDKPKKDDGTRMVRGVVRDPGDNFVDGAVVKVKDTKTLTIRSYITKSDGVYSFQGLSKGVDYEIHAELRDGTASAVKVLSVYDNRREAIINLKIEPKN